jgi:dTDP-4-dehydrorhamnose reductase
MKKILVLGHKGMLGNAVESYLRKTGKYEIVTIEARYGASDFGPTIVALNSDVIVNCIGLIPQKKPRTEEYTSINVDLPIFLETLGKKIVHPTTDCEFLGDISSDRMYTKANIRDASDPYGLSKAIISKRIEEDFKNTKMLRVSIIGHELNSHNSLLDWFLNSEDKVNGYTSHYWNGITTIEWSKLCEELIDNWDAFPVLNQYGTDQIASKYDLLTIMKEVYEKDIDIIPFATETTVNKCLASDKLLPGIREQLIELKKFYQK